MKTKTKNKQNNNNNIITEINKQMELYKGPRDKDTNTKFRPENRVTVVD